MNGTIQGFPVVAITAFCLGWSGGVWFMVFVGWLVRR